MGAAEEQRPLGTRRPVVTAIPIALPVPATLSAYVRVCVRAIGCDPANLHYVARL